MSDKLKKTGVWNSSDFITYTTLSDGSVWLLINYLDVTTDKTFFTTSEVTRCHEDNRFSIMGLVDGLKTSAGIYEFMLSYPSLSTTLYNRWTQTNSPNTASGTVTGFTAVTTAWNNYNKGICKSASSSTVYNTNNGGGTWFGAIGQTSSWTSTLYIPAANGSSQTISCLWIRVDNLPDYNPARIFDDMILTDNFYEI